MTSNITITKGEISVTIYTVEVTDDYSNDVKIISIPVTAQNQANGPKDAKVIDLLRLTHEMQIRGHLDDTTDRDNLITIFKGANTEGGPCSVTYSTYPTNPLSMYCSKLMILEKATDKNSPKTMFEVQLTLIEGVKM